MLTPNATDSRRPAGQVLDRKKSTVLTNGLCRSAFTDFIAGPVWCPEDRASNKEYDAYENHDLVRLNSELLKQAADIKDFTSRFPLDIGLVLSNEDLIVNFDKTLIMPDARVGGDLESRELRAIYTGRVAKLPSSHCDLGQWVAIHLETYGERLS